MKGGKSRSALQLALLEEGVSEPVPSTRYQGSKAKLVHWIWEQTKDLEFDTVLDVFGGTGVVGYFYKRKGKAVHYNDYLRSNYLIGVALIENNSVRVSDSEIRAVTLQVPGKEYERFISETFHGIYYTEAENEWLDLVVQNINQLVDPYKKALAFYALFQACLVKRPFNLFHRKNLYLRFADVRRTFGNKTTWDKPFAEHFFNFVLEANALVFDNGRENSASNLDAFEVEGHFDLVYIDPPYTSQAGVTVDYLEFYHFLEGLSQYDRWRGSIDFRFKHHPFRQKYNRWNDPKHVGQAFCDLFEKFRRSIIVVSYREDGIPSIEDITRYLRSFKRNVRIASLSYQYVLSNNKGAEVLIVGYP